MGAPIRDEARGQAGFGETAQHDNFDSKTAIDPRVNQGIAARRNNDQPSPIWPAPRGAAAAQDLERALAGWTAMLGRPPVDPTAKRRRT